MEVFLYNSTVCRLCGEENDCGTLLYSSEENNQNLSDLINSYLPIKVSDDGQLPRTICPGCTIQVEATVEFLNLIIKGQKVIRELFQREKEYKKTVFNAENEPEVVTEKIVYEINTSTGVYQVEHPIALQVAGLDKPKRKRGRPPKKPKSAEEIEQEHAAKENEMEAKKMINDWCVTGKRRRKTPTRFREAVQGKELERIFKEEGVIDAEETEGDVKLDVEGEPGISVREPEVIGHLETSGELVVVVKGKGRGRPKGRMRPTSEECLICGMKFSCSGRYMAHVAQHGAVRYCCSCGNTHDTRLLLETHQKMTGHTGHSVLHNDAEEKPPTQEPPTNQEQPTDPLESINNIPASLPNLTYEVPIEKQETVDPELLELDNKENVSSPSIDTSNVEKPAEAPIAPAEEAAEVGPKGKVKLKCNHCDKYFSSKQSKSLHIKAVHQGERPYVCIECGCRFAYPRCLALHQLSHRRQRAASRRFACDLCGKVLNHPSSVVYHKEAEHAGQRYVCNKCGKCFKHKQLLQRHQLVHSQLRPYSCKICNASFKTKANLLNHQLLHTGIKKFTCEICKQKFAHKTSLTLHMRWHTGLKPYACEICGKCFSQKGNLSEHSRIHTGEKPYQCSHCPRRFTTSSQYRFHTRKHQVDRPYPCSHCSKRFSTKSAWAAHMRRWGTTHPHTPSTAAPTSTPAPTPATPHHCPVCQRSFGERAALHKHMRRHTGERPYKCTHCPRAFADCSNLNKHKKQVHKQISLLVNTEPQPSPVQPQEETLDVIEAANQLEERVIYVTYDVGDNEPGFHILDPEQGLSDGSGAVELMVPTVGAGNMSPPPPPPPPPLLNMPHDSIEVTDEEGNPLHFTMQDGTRLAITSTDGKSLQVITHDGQTIPVEINELEDDEEEAEDPRDTVIHMKVEESDHNVTSPVTHYFTIV